MTHYDTVVRLVVLPDALGDFQLSTPVGRRESSRANLPSNAAAVENNVFPAQFVQS
jgi:hypothetical protein